MDLLPHCSPVLSYRCGLQNNCVILMIGDNGDGCRCFNPRKHVANSIGKCDLPAISDKCSGGSIVHIFRISENQKLSNSDRMWV